MSTNALDITDDDRFMYEAGIRLEAARLTLGRTATQMTEMLGCPRSTYSEYIRGKRLVPPFKLRDVVSLGIPSDFIYYGIKTSVPSGIIAALDQNLRIAAAERAQPVTTGRPARNGA